ncbi:MAG: type II secretion system protein [Actinomycetota bacterium]|nr:type II secretion system protein [Actinomycetota bacterium]MDA8173025.1 type II secretion system protein [Nitrospiraceae bacterium]
MKVLKALGRYATGLLMKTRQCGRAAKAGKEGFTLIELLIALAVFSLGMMAVASGFMTSFAMLRTQAELSTANSLTQQAMEMLGSQPPVGVSGGLANLASMANTTDVGNIVNGTIAMNGTTYTMYVQVQSVNISNTSEYLADVTISWPDARGGAAHHVTHEQLLPPPPSQS